VTLIKFSRNRSFLDLTTVEYNRVSSNSITESEVNINE
jgi:hypothetical protein